jgi:hypothetical protein
MVSFDDLIPQKQNKYNQVDTAEASYLDDLKASLMRRQAMTGDAIRAYREGKQTLPETALQVVGKGTAGLINDIAGETLTHGASAITPDFIENPVKKGVGNAVAYIADSAVGDVAADYAARYKDFTVNNPRAARNIEAVGNIGGVLAATTPVNGKSIANTVVDAAGNAGKVVAKPLAPAIDKLTDLKALSAAKKTGEISNEALSKGMRKIYDRLRADYPDQAEFERVLNSLGSSSDKALIQAGGKRVESLGKGAAQYPSGEAVAREFFDEATGAAPEKIKKTLSKTVSPSANYSSDVDALLDAGRAKAAPLYKQAFKSNQAINTPVINKILQTPEGKSALSEAVKNLQNEMSRVAVPDKELTAIVKELSDIGLAEAQPVARGLKLRTLDEVKRAMDSTIRSAYRTGKSDQEIARFVSLKNALVSELDRADSSGLYSKARSVAGDYLSSQKAMEDGLSFLREDAENIPRRLSNMGTAEKQAYRAGVVKALRNDIDTKYDGQNVARLFQKPATRQKLQSLLSPKEYAKLLDDAKVTDEIFKLRNQIVGGSPTAGKQIAAQEFQQAGQEIAVDLATGSFARAGMKTAQNMANKMFDGLSDKSAKEVAELLYTKDPKQKYKIIKQLLNESKKSGSGLQSTQAAQKLKAFYAISDSVREASTKNAGSAAIGASAIGSAMDNSEMPQVRGVIAPAPQNSPSMNFDDLIPAKPQSNADPLNEKIKMSESGGNPNAQNPNSSASGLYQFTDATWRSAVDKWGRKNGIKYGDKSNPQAQEAMMEMLKMDNARVLQNKGIEPSDANLYFAHFMGAPAASKAISLLGKRAIAARSFPDAAKANPEVFFNKGKPRTIDEVYEIITSKVG